MRMALSARERGTRGLAEAGNFSDAPTKRKSLDTSHRLRLGPPRAGGSAAVSWAAAIASEPCSRNATRVPFSTVPASSLASQLVRRMQPCDSLLLTFDGSGVPWMP
jgi:hypothetical protein